MYFRLTARRFLMLLCAGLTFATDAGAQDRPIELIPADTRAELNSSLSNVVNSLHVFSSSDDASSGSYSFEEDNQPDSDLDVQKLATDISFGDAETDPITPFVSGMLGHVKLVGQIPPSEVSGTNDFVTFETTSVGLGGGVDITVFDTLHFVPKMLFVYSHTSNEYDYNNQESQTFLAPFDGDLFNWDVDTMTYLPSAEVYYLWNLGKLRIKPSVHYSHVDVHSVWTNSQLLDVSTSSDIIYTKLTGAVQLGLEVACMPLELEGFVGRHDIFGDAREATGIKRYHEVGAVLYARTENSIPLFTKLGLGSSYAWNSDFDGWRVGLQGEF